ncbi:MAG: DUF3617 domain-containing protein [Erythrobacter sp.]|nr:MAG: DUF3617 domain-containing protein [Erythrobacter sp.]
MRISTLIAAASIFALTACGDSGTVEDPGDPDQVAAAMADIAKPQPGEYTTTGELIDFEISGASEEEQAMMRGFMEMGAAQTQTICITEEQADAGFEEFLGAMQENSDECTFTNFSVDGDTLDATMNCDDGAGSTGTIEFGGTIAETSQDMTVTMNMTNATEGQTMRMVLRNQTERVGECSATTGAG